jgi:hypothetical protein
MLTQASGDTAVGESRFTALSWDHFMGRFRSLEPSEPVQRQPRINFCQGNRPVDKAEAIGGQILLR